MKQRVTPAEVLRGSSFVVLAGFLYQYILIPLAQPFVALPFIFPPYSAFGMLLVVFFSAAHASYTLGVRNASVFFGVSVVLSWIIESIGVRTGIIFGHYNYTSSGPYIGSVPVEIPLLWFGLLYLGYALANAIAGHRDGAKASWPWLVWLSFLGAAVVTARDIVIEPLLARPGVLNRPWVWDEAGEYFGVPVQNFYGWMFAAFVVFVAYRSYERFRSSWPLGGMSRSFALLPVLFYAGLGVVDVMNAGTLTALPTIAFFAMGIPALIASVSIVFRRGNMNDL